MSTDKRSIDWYNQHAQDYTNHVRDPKDSVYHSLYEKPAMYAQLPDLQGKSALSLGSGSGEDCHYLSQQGATQITGIDISEELVKIAKDSYPECKFQVMDMEHLGFDDASFDFVYSSLAIHYIEDWSQVFREVYRVLKPKSYFLFSCGHPVYSAMQINKNDEMKVYELSRTVDRKTDEVTIVGDYVNRRVLVEEDPSWGVTSWHKSIGEISSEATTAGLLIAGIIEPKPLPAMRELSPKDYNTLIKIPNFIIFKLLKPTSKPE